MKSAWKAAAVASLVALVCGAISITVVACSTSERDAAPPAQTKLAEPTDVIDDGLMVALGQAKNFHRKAKVYMSDGNLAAATASVRQILSLRFPKGAPEAEDVRQDARALLAKLLISQNQLDEANTVVEEGLAQSQRESFFVANLYTVQGEIHEARAAAADAQGDTGKAKATEERHAAIASYDKSIAINEKLQKQLMEDR